MYSEVIMDATVDDCHHGGCSEWGVLRNELYTRFKSSPPQSWTKVKRINYTPKRIRLIASLLP